MTVSVLVPLDTGGCPWRERAWEFVESHYRRHHPNWDLIVGSCEGAWSKGTAVADALTRAGGDQLVIGDADSFVDPDVLRSSVENLTRHNWISPHLRVRRLNRSATRRVLVGGEVRPHHLDRAAYIGLPGGGITIIRRSAYELVPIDPRFFGWGGEDISWAAALETLVEPAQRLTADLIHLWHPHAAPTRRGCPASEALAGRYREARGDLAEMRALIEEAHATA